MRSLCCLLFIAACGPNEPAIEPLPDAEAPTDPSLPGPYAVGAMSHRFTDARGVKLTVEIWYPALPHSGDEPSDYGDLSLVRAAYRDAPPDHRSTPFPLVAFSHGYGGVRYQSTFLTEHLASHGFVVVAPDHPNNTLFDLQAELTGQVALARPADISSAVDQVFSLSVYDDTLKGLVDTRGFGMLGHSFGGWTALAVSGGQVDLDATARHCANTPTASCNFLDLSAVDDASDTAPDPRVVAMIALAPGGAYTFAQASLHAAPHALVIGGQRDGDMPYDSEIVPAFAALGSGATLFTLARSGHWAFTDLCDLIDVFDDCQGEAADFMKPSAVQSITNTVVVAHFRRYMLDHEDDDAWLSPQQWQDNDDVTVQTAP